MPTDLEIAFPTLSDHDLAALRARGRERAVDAGEILYSAGDTVVGFFVVLAGEVEVVDGVGDDARFIHHLDLALEHDEEAKLACRRHCRGFRRRRRRARAPGAKRGEVMIGQSRENNVEVGWDPAFRGSR